MEYIFFFCTLSCSVIFSSLGKLIVVIQIPLEAELWCRHFYIRVIIEIMINIKAVMTILICGLETLEKKGDQVIIILWCNFLFAWELDCTSPMPIQEKI
jgi:hypothetical protein